MPYKVYEIELVTTKRKLTKSTIKQMKSISPTHSFINIRPIGFIRNLNTRGEKHGLLESHTVSSGKEYFILNMRWEMAHGNRHLRYKLPGTRGEYIRSLTKEQQQTAEKWFLNYQEIVSKLEGEGQIYL